eukprot:gene4276-776_t
MVSAVLLAVTIFFSLRRQNYYMHWVQIGVIKLVCMMIDLQLLFVMPPLEGFVMGSAVLILNIASLLNCIWVVLNVRDFDYMHVMSSHGMFDTDVKRDVFTRTRRKLCDLRSPNKIAKTMRLGLFMHRNFTGQNLDPTASFRRAPSFCETEHMTGLDGLWKLQALFRGQQLRKRMMSWVKNNFRIFLGVYLVMFLLHLAGTLYEFSKIFINQPPIFTDDELTSLNDPNLVCNHHRDPLTPGNVSSYFGPDRLHQGVLAQPVKVHIIVVDGLGHNYVIDDSFAITEFLRSSDWSKDAVTYKMVAQLPSFSVPNWASLLTGSPPENTGVTGNLFNSETEFDHYFRQAKLFGVHSGLTGSPWWKNLISSYLPFLSGDGTVSTKYVSPAQDQKYAHETSDPADWARLNVALEAIDLSLTSSCTMTSVVNGTLQDSVWYPEYYTLFLTHFSDVDAQGHAYGVGTAWNQYDSYRGAVLNKTKALQAIIDAVDQNTVIVMTSDHGHVLRGGHGGVGNTLTGVPLSFYLKGSNWGSRVPAQVSDPKRLINYGDVEFDSLDFAPTISMLLGLPAPRQALGMPMEEIMHLTAPDRFHKKIYQDVMMQKRNLLGGYVDRLLAFYSNNSNFKELGDTLPLVSDANATSQQYAQGSIGLMERYWWMRNIRMVAISVRNLFANMVVTGLVAGLGAVILEKATPVSLWSLVLSQPDYSHVTSLNRRALGWALLSVTIFYGVSMALFFIVWFPIIGYDRWDSTMTHAPTVGLEWLLTTLLMPTAVSLFIERIFMMPHYAWKTSMDRSAGDFIWCLARDMGLLLFGTTTRIKKGHFKKVLLWKLYRAFLVMVAMMILFAAASPYTFVFPVLFSTTHVNRFNLVLRFRVMTCQILTIPLAFDVLWGLIRLYWTPPSKWSLWDDVFMKLLIPKFQMQFQRILNTYSRRV